MNNKGHTKQVRVKRINQYSDYKKGDNVFFTYKCFESDQSCDAELWHHTKQIATIIKKLPKKNVDENVVGQMYVIQFSDGFTYDVISEELELIKRNR